MSCHWHNFHTIQNLQYSLISYLYNVWTQAMNTINMTTCHHGYINDKFSWIMMMVYYNILYFQCTYIMWVTKVLCISKRISNYWKKVLLNVCKWIVVIRKFNFSELALYIFNMDCQTFVRDIFMIRFAKTCHIRM